MLLKVYICVANDRVPKASQTPRQSGTFTMIDLMSQPMANMLQYYWWL